MDVIHLPRWRVLCFVDEFGQNVIHQWLDREGVSNVLRGEMQGRIDFIEVGGPNMVPGCVAPVPNTGGALFTLSVERPGTGVIRPLFCYGPFGDQELTLLLGVPDKTLSIHKPRDGIDLAMRNRERLIKYPKVSKRYERIVRTSETRSSR